MPRIVVAALLVLGCGSRTGLDTASRDGSSARDAERPCATAEDCDDGLACNGYEHCGPERMCQRSSPPLCDDGVACTVDRCVEPGICASEPDPARCPSGDICDPVFGCLGPGCDDALDCDDGAACNGVETCRGGTCAPGTPPSCDDGIECTEDLCVDAAGGCVSTPRSERCPDARICSPADGGCAPARRCSTDPECIDEFTCDGPERCIGGSCRRGIPIACDDGVACTIDRCVERLGCLSAPRDLVEVCDNGVDDDCDGLLDCDAIECRGTPDCACVPRGDRENDCFDGADDDCDSDRDCEDPDCARQCIRPELCDNRVDDDFDGLIDCSDTLQCRFDPGCSPGLPDGGVIVQELGVVACTNGIDDDGNGYTDCRAPGCGTNSAHGDCCNGIDDNGNGDVDESACSCGDDSHCAGAGDGEFVCWERSSARCGPRCDRYGGDFFCRRYAPEFPSCNPVTGDCGI